MGLAHPNPTNNAISKTLFNLPRGINLEGSPTFLQREWVLTNFNGKGLDVVKRVKLFLFRFCLFFQDT